MIDPNTHVTYLDPEELGEQEECLGVPRLLPVLLRDAVVTGPRPRHGHSDPRHDNGDQVTGLAAEHTRGQPQVVHAEVNVTELKLRLEQLQPPPDGTESELSITEEQNTMGASSLGRSLLARNQAEIRRTRSQTSSILTTETA